MKRWYSYQGRNGERIVRPMEASDAAFLGAVLEQGFDPYQRVAGMVALRFPPNQGEVDDGDRACGSQ